MKTAQPSISVIRDAQSVLRHCLVHEADISVCLATTHAYEDIANGLTGEFVTYPQDTQIELELTNYDLFLLAADKGITLNLHDSIMPTIDTITETQEVIRTGKKLYPKTITILDSSLLSSSNVSAVPATTNTLKPTNANVQSSVDASVFDAVDAITHAPPTFASEQVNDPYTPMMSNALVELALVAAANTEGLQAGLTTFSYNPLNTIIEDSRDLLLYYTENNYANLNTTLTGISSNASLNVEYKTLRESIGGSDGLSGCVAQLDVFLDHTNRLSGLTLDKDSDNAEDTADSLTEYRNLYGLTGGPTEIFRFNARKFRSAKYLIQATSANADRGHTVTELYILHDNHHPYTREVISMYSQEPFVEYTTQLLSGNIRVLATTTSPNTDFVIHGTRLQVSRSAQSYANVSQTKILEHHMSLSTYLNDGVDYVRLQSESLYNASVVGNIAREIRDLLSALSNSVFLAGSDPAQAATINAWATVISTRQNTIQSSIETDYTQFLTARKKSEALDIAFSLATGYIQPNANSTLQSTLNSISKAAIEEHT